MSHFPKGLDQAGGIYHFLYWNKEMNGKLLSGSYNKHINFYIFYCASLLYFNQWVRKEWGLDILYKIEVAFTYLFDSSVYLPPQRYWTITTLFTLIRTTIIKNTILGWLLRANNTWGNKLSATLNHFRMFNWNLMANIDLGNFVKGTKTKERKPPFSMETQRQESLQWINQ